MVRIGGVRRRVTQVAREMCTDLRIPVPVVNWRWCRDVALQYALVIAAGAALARWWWLAPLVWVIFGTRQAALAVLGHDATHRHVLPGSPRLNDALGAIAFWPIVTTIAGYRRFHFAHHARLGTDWDPELFLMRKHWRAWQPTSKGWQSVRDMCGAGVPEIVAVNHVMLDGHEADALPMLATVSATVAGLLWFGYWLPVLVWFVSLGTVFWSLLRVRSWSEHFDNPPDGTWKKQEPPLLVRWGPQPFGIWMHWEHHKWPSVASRELLHIHRGSLA